ncbi:MAG: YraN family protein [Patescibacteria group bacterium]
MMLSKFFSLFPQRGKKAILPLSKKDTGKIGENLARRYLEKRGYKIIEQNWSTRYGEIDIVAENKDCVALVEVRTKVGEQFGTPEETLNYTKMQKVLGNALAYMGRKRTLKPYRIDAVCVVLDESRNLQRINHYENIVG